MDNNQQLLVSLLSASIRGRIPEKIETDGVNWEAVYEEAKAHQVHVLIYPILKTLGKEQSPGAELMAKLEKSTMAAAMWQMQHVQMLGTILEAFRRKGIPVIALKGLVIRELYPHPELRTMGDADILVHMEDLEHIKDLLLEMGYSEDCSNPVHIHFHHKIHMPIEVHWSLINEECISSAACLEDSAWKNAVPADVCGVPALTLSLEDQVLHLCLHMAVHIVYSGFGLRQLCDLVLFVESKRDMIDWNLFNEKSKECGIERFVHAIFAVCRELFDMHIPIAVNCPKLENDPYIKLLIDDVFSGGVFGSRTAAREMGNKLLRRKHKGNFNNSQGNQEYFLSILFPAADKLGERYDYARKHPFLTPAAWIHRFIRYILRKDLSASDKMIFSSVYSKRAKLLGWLNLQ